MPLKRQEMSAELLEWSDPRLINVLPAWLERQRQAMKDKKSGPMTPDKTTEHGSTQLLLDGNDEGRDGLMD